MLHVLAESFLAKTTYLKLYLVGGKAAEGGGWVGATATPQVGALAEPDLNCSLSLRPPCPPNRMPAK